MKKIAITAGAQLNITNINTILTKTGGAQLIASQPYLCDEGNKSFTMGGSSSATAADADSQTNYKLRAVKTLTATVGN